MTPYYQDDNVAIYHADCLEFLHEWSLGGGPNFDMIFTSPPYNKGLRIDGNWIGPVTTGSKSVRFRNGYGTHDDAMPMAEYEAWQKKVLKTLCEHVYPYGTVFYNHKQRIVNGRLWTPLSLVDESTPLRQIIMWDKVNVGVDLMPGAFASRHEWLMFFAWDGYNFPDGKTASSLGDVWRRAPERVPGHPAPFPVSLPELAMTMLKPEVVCDPFMGSGSTLLAAKQKGIQAIGIEIEERYCEIAARRLSQEVLAV